MGEVVLMMTMTVGEEGVAPLQDVVVLFRNGKNREKSAVKKSRRDKGDTQEVDERENLEEEADMQRRREEEERERCQEEEDRQTRQEE